MTDPLIVSGKSIPLDKEGYLANLEDWTPQIAECLAEREGIQLSPRHWEVLNLVREFYDGHGLSPMMRVIVKQMKITYGDEKGSSMYLLSLFPEYPALIATKIAGLPRPTNCP
jgi:tRNA 2-thiouridine synthesizing protein E